MPTPQLEKVILRLTVRDHPGVLSHVGGLFSRRAFNVEGVLCLPCEDGRHSTILLRVRDDARLEQLVRQLAKLEDVRDVRIDAGAAGAFEAVAACLRESLRGGAEVDSAVGPT